MKMHKGKFIEISRIIVARKMKIPPDDIDMAAIFTCVLRSIEEKVDENLEEPELVLSSKREKEAVVSEIGETVIPMMFKCEYPFGNFVEDYELYHRSQVGS